MKGEGGFFEKVLGKESNSPWSKSLFFFFLFFLKGSAPLLYTFH